MDKFSKDNSNKYTPMLDLLENKNLNKTQEKTPYGDSDVNHKNYKSVSGSSVGKSYSTSTLKTF